MKGDFRALLAEKLEPWELNMVNRSYDIVGDIAIIRLPESLKHQTRIIAEAVMKTNRRVKTVLQQVSSVSGDFRLRGLEWIGGERRTETIYREHGCLAKVDLRACYFSPRLSYERMRIAQKVQPKEVVVNMFAGVGCYSIIIAKLSEAERVYSIDINPIAVQYMRESIRLNKVERRVVPMQGDARKIVREELQNVADRVLMPLPEKAYEYLDCALSALKPLKGWVHYYDFEHARKDENPIEKTKEKVSRKLKTIIDDFEIQFGRVVRRTGPNWYQIVLDVQVWK
jgi:tRNA (guanine37-N1)-methyltransferase